MLFSSEREKYNYAESFREFVLFVHSEKINTIAKNTSEMQKSRPEDEIFYRSTYWKNDPRLSWDEA